MSFPTNDLYTICPCLCNPELWRYMGEGFEAVVFEFIPPPQPTTCPSSSTQPDPINHPNIHLKHLCVESLNELVLRVPKTKPQLLETFLPHTSPPSPSSTTPQSPPQSQQPPDAHAYFHFKHHVLPHLLPAPLIPHEIPLLLSLAFISPLFHSIQPIRPKKRQLEYPMDVKVQEWKNAFPDSLGTMQIQCLLMQDFTKHRILHRVYTDSVQAGKQDEYQQTQGKLTSARHENIDLDDLDTSLTHSHKDLSICHTSHQHPPETARPSHTLQTFSNTTIAFEIKPKWGYVRRSKCFPTENLEKLDKVIKSVFPHAQNDRNSINSTILTIFQNIFFFYLCRTCSLRAQRKMVSKEKEAKEASIQQLQPPQPQPQPQPQVEKPAFCPLDLYSIAHYRWQCPHMSVSPATSTQQRKQRQFCQDCVKYNKSVKTRLKTAIDALFAEKSPNLICSIHSHTTTTTTTTPTSPYTTTHSAPTTLTSSSTIPSIELPQLLETIMISPPLTRFFDALQHTQYLLDPVGPQYRVYHGCTCREIPINPANGKKIFSMQKPPSVALWGKAVKARLARRIEHLGTFDVDEFVYVDADNHEGANSLNKAPISLFRSASVSSSASDPQFIAGAGCGCENTAIVAGAVNNNERTESLQLVRVNSSHSTTSAVSSQSLFEDLTLKLQTDSQQQQKEPSEVIDEENLIALINPNSVDNFSFPIPFATQCQHSLDCVPKQTIISLVKQLMSKNQPAINSGPSTPVTPSPPVDPAISSPTTPCFDVREINHADVDPTTTANNTNKKVSATPKLPKTTIPPRMCSACRSRVCFVSSMTIKDLSFYLSITPLTLSSTTPLQPNQPQFLNLGDHAIPIITNEQFDTNSTHTPLNISSLGYFLFPIPHTLSPATDPHNTQSLPLLLHQNTTITPNTVTPYIALDHLILPTSQPTKQPHKFNYFLCRMQCGDIGPKPYDKYKKYIIQEENILAACFQQLRLNLE